MGQGLRGNLQGKVAIVTGSTQGVGEAIAVRIAEWGGAGVLITGRNAERGAAVVERLRALGAKGHFVAADLGDAAAPACIVAAAETAFGRVDCLVNSAGNTERGGLLEAEPAFFDEVFAANVRAPFFLMQHAARLMRAHGKGGAIVNILSMNAHCGQPELAVYSGSKGALATLTRSAANALLGDRIRVNGINLGWAETPAEHVVQEKTSPYGKDWLAHANRTRPFGRLIQVDEIADLAAFLLSRHAGVMTGALVDFEQWVLGAPPAE